MKKLQSFQKSNRNPRAVLRLGAGVAFIALLLVLSGNNVKPTVVEASSLSFPLTENSLTENTNSIENIIEIERGFQETISATLAYAGEKISIENMGEAKNSNNAEIEAARMAVETYKIEKFNVTEENPTGNSLNYSLTKKLLFIEDPAYIEEVIKEAKISTETNTTELRVIVDNWVSLVAKENARLVEEQRLAEEQRVAEERSNAPRFTPSTGGTRENLNSRVQRIAATLPLSLPPIYVGDSCQLPGLILGCYQWGDDYIRIQTRAGQYPDCAIREFIAHEYRHWRQYLAGLWDNGVPWLEADAYAFAEQYGC